MDSWARECGLTYRAGDGSPPAAQATTAFIPREWDGAVVATLAIVVLFEGLTFVVLAG
jgi:hypothetical protein